MRWLWIDRIVELEPGRRLVALKHLSLAEEHLADHFPADESRGLAPAPVMPASLIIEGMAQSAGILVGHSGRFREKVILAKIGRAELDRDVPPGRMIRYTAALDRLDQAGAAATGTVEMFTFSSADQPPRAEPIGRIDLMFSHLDRNAAGESYPEHNFVFGEAFRTLLRLSGFDTTF